MPFKHATHCLAAATHYLLRKKMFDLKISQAALVKEFVVAEKKLHLAISGRKHDPGKSFQNRNPVINLNLKRKRLQRQMSQKQMKWSKFQKTRNLHQKIGDANDDDDDDDSLPDTFSPQKPKKPKTSGTKEDQDEENTQTMNTDMPELISSDEDATPQQAFTTKKPSWKKPPHK